MTRKNHGAAASSAVPPCPELWRDIPGYEGAYQVSSRGRVRSLPRVIPIFDRRHQVSYSRPCPGKILRQAVCDRAGHVSVHLGKYCRGIPVHQLVMLAFHGSPPPGMETMHLNGIPTDNRPENLRYDTHSENLHDIYIQGGKARKLTAEDVHQIRFGLNCGIIQKELAHMYHVSRNTIGDIQHGRTFQWLTPAKVEI